MMLKAKHIVSFSIFIVALLVIGSLLLNSFSNNNFKIYGGYNYYLHEPKVLCKSAPYFYYGISNETYDKSEYIFPDSSNAKPAKDNSDFMITETNDSVCINGYKGFDNGTSNIMDIPNTLNGKKVVKIGVRVLSSGDDTGNTYLAPAIIAPENAELHISKYIKEIVYNNLTGIYEADCEIYNDFTVNKITVDDDNPYYSISDNILCTKDKSTALIHFGQEDICKIPSSINTIEASFDPVGMKKILIGKNVKKINARWYGVYGLSSKEKEERYGYTDIVIVGYKGTEAERFAKKNNIEFELIK